MTLKRLNLLSCILTAAMASCSASNSVRSGIKIDSGETVEAAGQETAENAGQVAAAQSSQEGSEKPAAAVQVDEKKIGYAAPNVLEAMRTVQLKIQTYHYDYAVVDYDLSPDGRYAVTASNDNTARNRLVRSGRPAGILSGHEMYLYCAAYSPDGKIIAAAAADGTIRLWNSATAKQIGSIEYDTGMASTIEFSPDGKNFAAAETESMRTFDIETESSGSGSTPTAP